MTININIFKCCIDKLTKKIYNKIKFLCKKHFFRACVAAVLAMLLFLSETVVGLSAYEGEQAGEVSLVLSDMQEDTVTVAVVLGDALAGLYARVVYDPEVATLVSAGLTEELDIEENILSLKESVGAVDLILDSRENALLGRVAELVFKIGSENAPINFKIEPREAYFWKNDWLVQLNLAASELQVSRAEKQECFYLEHSFSERNGGRFLSVTARIEQSCIAAGFEVTVLGSDSMLCESYRTLNVMPRSGGAPCLIYFESEIGQSGIFCIAIYPVAYQGRDTVRGEGILLVFSDGALLEKNSIQ